MLILRPVIAGMMISSVFLGASRDNDETRPLPLFVALPIIGTVSLGLWAIIYKVVSGIVALFG